MDVADSKKWKKRMLTSDDWLIAYVLGYDWIILGFRDMKLLN